MRAKKKRNKKLTILIYAMVAISIVIIVIVFYMARRNTGFERVSDDKINQTLPEVYLAPEEAEWYTVDNTQFGIDKYGRNARATTDGINQALVWAKEQGYEYIKFAQGVYLIQCTWNDRYIAPNDGILVPSGLTLDLGKAVFQIESNSYPAYCVFGVVDQENITILGGTIIGDRESHVFSASINSHSHEWGFGICISASSNVLIQDVTIMDMTGDGIILEGSYDYLSNGGRESSDIRVINCSISNCRRQGVSVVGATDSEIAGNEIFDISGTDPQFGIDVEPELDYIADNIKIHNNLIYDCSGGAITASKGANYEIYANNCIDGGIIAVESSNVKIYNNRVSKSLIRVYKTSSDIQVYNNQFDFFSKLMIE